MSLVETTCQHRKSELLYFLPVISAGVNLPHSSSDLELCNCRGSTHWPLGASPGTDESHCLFCWCTDLCEAESLSYLGHLHVSWDLALLLQDLLPSMSHWVQSGSLFFWGNLHSSRSLAKNFVMWENCPQLCFFYFLEVIQSSEGGDPRRRLLESKSAYDSVVVLACCLERAKVCCLK